MFYHRCGYEGVTATDGWFTEHKDTKIYHVDAAIHRDEMLRLQAKIGEA